MLSGAVGVEYRRLEVVAIDRVRIKGRIGRRATRYIQLEQDILLRGARVGRTVPVAQSLIFTLCCCAEAPLKLLPWHGAGLV